MVCAPFPLNVTLVFLVIRSAVPFIVQLPATRICASALLEKSVLTPLLTTTLLNWFLPGASKAFAPAPAPANSIVPPVESNTPKLVKLWRRRKVPPDWVKVLLAASLSKSVTSITPPD